MARSYQYDPFLIPNIFRELVDTVSDNLSTDTDLDIAQVSFKHGSWLKIQAQLMEEAKSESQKNIRFPLIAMIHRYKEGYESNDDEFTADFIIFARRDKTARVKESYEGNFPNVLNPIYAEFRQVVCDSSYFRGYNHAKNFPKMDIVDAGEAAQYGNVRYEIPEHLDAVVIKDLSLTVIRQSCSALQACAHDYDIEQLNYIGAANLSGLNSASLTIDIGDDDVIETGLTPTYTITITGNGGTTSPVAFTIGTPYVIDVSGYQNGVYTGNVISSSTAEMEFCFTVAAGRVTALTKVIITSLDLDLACLNWPDYPFAIVHSIDGGGALQLTEFEGEEVTQAAFHEGEKTGDIDAALTPDDVEELLTVAMTNNQSDTTTIQKIFIKIQKNY
jgi:hypothetical protein